ncbi:MAG TPA: SdrD B-like domain-containing protein [Candidatus Paceibacterota bacterium]|nr:SdrD B-like domain-containing protein [Candidatus Paceibacterota bacterium]
MKNLSIKLSAFWALLNVIALVGFSPATNAQPIDCWLDIPLGNNTGTVILSAPWVFGYPNNNVSAAKNPSYLSNYVAVGTAAVPRGAYRAWCASNSDFLDYNPTIYNALFFSSCDPNLDSYLHALNLAFPSSVYIGPAGWQKVNYMLNHRNGAYFYDFQLALWNLVGGPIQPESLQTPPYPPYNLNVVNQLVADANANAQNWKPKCGDVMAVVIAIPSWSYLVQLTIIEVPVPCVSCVSVTKKIACLTPQITAADFGKVAAGFKGSEAPAFAYSITVTNCGNTILTNLTVVDDMFGDITTNLFAPGSILAPGGSTTYTYAATIASDTTNTVFVNAQSSESGAVVHAQDQALAVVHPATVSCDLTVVSSCDKDGQPADNHVLLSACSDCNVTFKIQVKNTGMSDLTGVTVSSPALTGIGLTMPAAFDLAAGASQEFEWTASVSCPGLFAYLSVTASVSTDTNHCAIYDIDTKPITVNCTSAGKVECETDNEIPRFTKIPGNQDLGCNPPSIPSCDTSAVTATDDTGTPTITCSSVDTTNGCAVIRTITYTAIDACGKTATAKQIITWTQDSVPPAFTALPAGDSLGCNPANLPTDDSIKSGVGASDNCGVAGIAVTHVDSGTPCAMLRTFTVTATDGCGNSTNATVSYTWKADTNAPVLVCPPDITVSGSNSVALACGFTQGGWGAPCNGYNPATILSNYFNKVYTNGYVECGIPGSAGRSMKFTSAAAIRAYLPAGGTPGVLGMDYLNPTSTSAGVFAGQVLALQLNVDFGDQKNITGFLGGLGDLVFHDSASPLDGKTVRQILAICNTALGGGNVSATGCSISYLNTLCDSFNQAFDGCKASSWCGSHLSAPVSTDVSTAQSGVATAIDDCDPNPVVTYSDATTTGPCAGTSIILRTWKAVDSCGNTSTCTQTISIGNTKSSICGHVFADCDGNGDLSGNDAGLTNVLVTLKNSSSNTVATTTTDADGSFCFYDIPAGNYYVVVVPPAGYQQTAGSTQLHYKDESGYTCWKDNDGYTHKRGADGRDCWTAKDGYTHWKDDSGRDCWKDRYGFTHTQNCNYTSCYIPKNNTEYVQLSPCESESGVNFAYIGIAPKATVCVSGPTKAKCGETITYTCTITNTGNACFTKSCQVTVCGRTYTCPQLSPGEGCSFPVKYYVKSTDYGALNCQATADCRPTAGNPCLVQSTPCSTWVSRY